MTTETLGDGATTRAATFRPIRLACPHCSEEVTRADLDAVIAEARRLLRFLDLAATT